MGHILSGAGGPFFERLLNFVGKFDHVSHANSSFAPSLLWVNSSSRVCKPAHESVTGTRLPIRTTSRCSLEGQLVDGLSERALGTENPAFFILTLEHLMIGEIRWTLKTISQPTRRVLHCCPPHHSTHLGFISDQPLLKLIVDDAWPDFCMDNVWASYWRRMHGERGLERPYFADIYKLSVIANLTHSRDSSQYLAANNGRTSAKYPPDRKRMEATILKSTLGRAEVLEYPSAIRIWEPRIRLNEELPLMGSRATIEWAFL